MQPANSRSLSDKAIFLDRDGTLHEDVGYLGDFRDFRPLAGVEKALRMLKEAGFRLFVTSNQSGIARGYFSLEQVLALNGSIREYFGSKGLSIEEFVICPHHPEGIRSPFAGECGCRKPKPGMIRYLQKKYNLDVTRSYSVGDKPTDAETGLNAGAKGAWIRPAGTGSVDKDAGYFEFPSLLAFAEDIRNIESR